MEEQTPGEVAVEEVALWSDSWRCRTGKGRVVRRCKFPGKKGETSSSHAVVAESTDGRLARESSLSASCGTNEVRRAGLRWLIGMVSWDANVARGTTGSSEETGSDDLRSEDGGR